MDWEKVRREDGTIQLMLAFREFFRTMPSASQIRYMLDVESICPIRSRQVAASVLANARVL